MKPVTAGIIFGLIVGTGGAIVYHMNKPRYAEWKPTPFLSRKADGGYAQCVTPVGVQPCKDVEVEKFTSTTICSKGPGGVCMIEQSIPEARPITSVGCISGGSGPAQGPKCKEWGIK